MVARHRWDPCAGQVHVVPPRRVGDGLSPDQARGPHWRRTSSALYVPSAVDPRLAQQRIVEEAARLPGGGAVTGWAACLLAGAAWFDGLGPDGCTQLPVELAVGPRGGVRPRPGTVVSFARLPDWEVWQRYGVRCARPERAVLDQMRRCSPWEAVVAESALAGEITSLERLTAFAGSHRAARRRAVAEWALSRTRGGARSPLEVRVRTVAEELAGYSRLEVNRVVSTREGTRIGEVDLLDLQSATAIEVDGRDHRRAAQQSWDITKEEALRSVGIEVARVTGGQARDAATLAGRLVAVRARSAFTAPEERRWSLAPCHRDTEAVLEERDHDAMCRSVPWVSPSWATEQSRGPRTAWTP